MGAMVTIRFADGVTDQDAEILAAAIQPMVEEAMGAKDVFVYADKAPHVVGADPIEVFVQVNALKVPDAAGLMSKLTERISAWKQQHNFAHPINLNVIPVEWHAKFGI